MTSEQWEKAQELARAAFDLDSPARADFLRSACNGDEEMRAEIESLMAFDLVAGDFIEEALLAVIEDLVPPTTLEKGQLIGPYRIERELGRGGTSVVYLASRADHQYEGQVAIKVVRQGLESKDLVRRFRTETQVLARLNHPNIARLIDAGATEFGLPYFVMELIDALPIDQYCAARGLSFDERIQLFRVVCSAVQFAHQNLIVHRDIKPSNILVTGAGEPKLVDFGIAKLLDSDANATRTASRMLTPGYASPEQIRGEPVSTASDVYSLGMLLYELLTGVRPYYLETLSPSEAERTVCEIEPEKPSAAVRSCARTGPDANGLRSAAQQDQLRRRISGDLDNIILTALHKEPGKRYQTVADLSEDLRRYLGGKPVSARKPTVSYRAGKFIRRHWAALAITGAVAAMLLSFVISSMIQSRKVSIERDRVKQVAAFLIELFEVSDPAQSRGRQIPTREILDRSALRINHELKDQPAVRAALIDTLGTVYERLGLYEQAEPLLREALSIWRREAGNESLEAAATLNTLSELLQLKGDNDGSEAACREALAIRLSILGRRHPDVAASLNSLGDILHDKGDAAAAEPLFLEALQMRRELLGPDDPSVAESLNNLALLHHDRAEYDQAEKLYVESLAIRRRSFGDSHPKVAQSVHNLGTLLEARGDLAAAEPLLREALEIDHRLFGRESVQAAIDERHIGRLLRAKADYEQAEMHLRGALAVLRRHADESRQEEIGTTLHELGGVFRAKGDYRQARALFSEAIDLYRKALPPGHAYLAHPMVGLGDALIKLGDDRAAEPVLREALEIRCKSLPEGHWRTAEAGSLLGSSLTGLGRYDEAEPLLIGSFNSLKASLGDDAPRTISALERLVRLYRASGKITQAAQYATLLSTTRKGVTLR